MESCGGKKQQRDTVNQGDLHLAHNKEKEQHRGRNLQGVIDQHVGKQDVTRGVQELPVARKDVQHDRDAAKEEAEEGNNDAHLDDHGQTYVIGDITEVLRQILHRFINVSGC